MFYYYRIAYLIMSFVDKTLLPPDPPTGLPSEGGYCPSHSMTLAYEQVREAVHLKGVTVDSINAALSTSFLSGERCRASAGDDSFQTSSHRLSTRLPEYYCAPILISRNTRWRSSSPISTHSSARNQDVRYFSRKHAENQVLAAHHLGIVHRDRVYAHHRKDRK